MGLRAPWLVLREGERRRWGGDLRRRYLLDGVVAAHGARVLDDWRPTSIGKALGELRAAQRRPWARPARWWVRRPMVAATEFLDELQLAKVQAAGTPWLVDVHDDPIRQAEALGIEFSAEVVSGIQRRLEQNLSSFRWVSAPSLPFAKMAGLPLERLLIAGNGTDSATVRPAPAPEVPGVAFISGAAPSRGIEELIDAVRLVRRELPTARLLLYLAATGDASAAYLSRLEADCADDPWITIGQAPYDALGEALGQATMLCIPTPAHAYWDSVPPLKLFDGMAAGRPHVVTPRTETARIVRDHDAGVVADGDDAASMAEAMLRLFADPAAIGRMGANARQAAEHDYDWRVIGARLAAELDRLSGPWARLMRRTPGGRTA